MPGILHGLRIAECAAFIACPYATMTLAELGAEVIRIDAIGGGLDYRRWPVTAEGRSLYWAGLNKGKKSVRIDIRGDEGRELAQAIITAPGENGGIFATNLPATGWLADEALRALRPDLIMATIVGNHDGSTALDYTVNCAAGFPGITGPQGSDAPVNHVLPAWDLLAGMSLATAILAAERHRRMSSEGQRIRIALSDVAFAVVSDLGYLAEQQINGTARGRHGNHIYGAFGHDFRDVGRPSPDGRCRQRGPVAGADPGDGDRRYSRCVPASQGRRPRPGSRPVRGTRNDRRLVAPVVRRAHPRSGPHRSRRRPCLLGPLSRCRADACRRPARLARQSDVRRGRSPRARPYAERPHTDRFLRCRGNPPRSPGRFWARIPMPSLPICSACPPA